MPNPDPPSPQSTVTRLPTELTQLFERTLASHDAAGTLARPEERADPHKQGATTGNADDLCMGGAAAQALDLGHGVPIGGIGSNMTAGVPSTDPIVQEFVDKIRGEMLEAAIGIGLLLVGIAVFVALALLPHKPGMWLFIFAAVVLMFAGGRRIDAATRTYRQTKYRSSRRAQ